MNDGFTKCAKLWWFSRIEGLKCLIIMHYYLTEEKKNYHLSKSLFMMESLNMSKKIFSLSTEIDGSGGARVRQRKESRSWGKDMVMRWKFYMIQARLQIWLLGNLFIYFLEFDVFLRFAILSSTKIFWLNMCLPLMCVLLVWLLKSQLALLLPQTNLFVKFMY